MKRFFPYKSVHHTLYTRFLKQEMMNNNCSSQRLLFIVSCLLFIGLLANPVVAQEIYNMSDLTVTDCEGILYDSGGAEDRYSNEEDLTFTICPDKADLSCIRLNFNQVEIENTFDVLSIYAGADTNATLVGAYPNEVPTLIDINSDCVTIHFRSNEIFNFNGWEMAWQCYGAEGCPEIPRNAQDCQGAIAICQEIYVEDNAFIGEGEVPNEINKDISCLQDGERNSVWYTFTVQQSGLLTFEITPSQEVDDYDWAVYNVTNNNCADLLEMPELEVSCSFSRQTGATGPTGESELSHAGADDGNQNAAIPVQEGEVYLINVSQFTTSIFGYTIDFSSSSAVIFDQKIPEIDTIELIYGDCFIESVKVTFTENILCQNIDGMNFTFEDSDVPIPIYTEDIVGEACLAASNNVEREFFLYINENVEIYGEHILTYTYEVEDLCGNVTEEPTVGVAVIEEPIPWLSLQDLECVPNASGLVNVNFLIEGDANQFYRVEGMIYDELIDTLVMGGSLFVMEGLNVSTNNTYDFNIHHLDFDCPIASSGSLEEQLCACDLLAIEFDTEGGIYICEGTDLVVEASIINNDLANHILSYYLMDEESFAMGGSNYLLASSDGQFTNIDETLNPYEPYLVMALLNEDTDNDGLADWTTEEECVARAFLTDIYLLEPITAQVEELCDVKTGVVTVRVMLSGGLPSLDNSINYVIKGDYTGTVNQGMAFTRDYLLGTKRTYAFEINTTEEACPALVLISPAEFACNYTPIEWLNVEGEVLPEGNLMSWQTGTETNNDYFVVERQNQAGEFVEIARLTGAGNSSRAQSYQFLDKFPLNGLSYYQIRQVDYDGQSSTSKVIALNRKESNVLTIYTYNEWINIIGEADATITIYNSTGQAVYQGKLTEDRQQITTVNWFAGLYLIEMTGKNNQPLFTTFVLTN